MTDTTMSLWKKNKLKLFEKLTGPVIFTASEEFGANFLIEALDSDAIPLIWFELTEQDVGDTVAQGNRLVEAVKRRLGDLILPLGMPFAYGVDMLKSHLAFIGPVTVAASNIQFAPNLAVELLTFARQGNQVILHSADDDTELPANVQRLNEKDLRLSFDEALYLAKGSADEEEVRQIFEESGYALTAFHALLEERFGLRPLLIPSPSGPRFSPKTGPRYEGVTLIRLFAEEGSYRDALELAVERHQEQVASIIEEAGHYFHLRGMHQRLYTLLSRLSVELLDHEFTLFWLLIASFRQDEHFAVREKVEQFLSDNQAPHLRAAYAGIFLSGKEARQEAMSAYESLSTPYTCFQYGRVLTDVDRAIEIHTEGLHQAERYDRAYEKTRAAGGLANKLISKGKFRDAVYWSAWGLSQYDKAGLSDYARRLEIENNWAYAKILCGETGGIEATLTLSRRNIHLAFPDIARRLNSTLAELLLIENRAAEALLITTESLEQVPRRLIGDYSLYHVRVFLELGELEAALSVAEQACALSGSLSYAEPYATLALGMTMSFINLERAVAPLTTSLEFFSTNFDASRFIQASLYLARAYLELESAEEARQVLDNLRDVIPELSKEALHLLGGPKASFRRVNSLLSGWETPLELKLLGNPSVWLEGQEVSLTHRQLELLTVMALKNRAVTPDEMTTLFGGKLETKANIKGEVARLRKKIPISQQTYSVELDYTADFAEIIDAIEQGEYSKAFGLFKGNLLPESDVEFIREADRFIVESLRQAALKSGDPDYLLTLLDHEVDDLELAEAALASLGKQDLRHQVAQARVIKIRESWSR